MSLKLIKIIIVASVILICSSALSAGILEFDSGTTLINAKKWIAGTDATEQWYGWNFSFANEYAELTATSSGNPNKKLKKGVNSILIAFELTTGLIGNHTWSIATRFSDFDTQYNYGQVLFLNPGQKIKLNKHIWNKPPQGAYLISGQQAAIGFDNLNWNRYGSTFEITQADIDNFQYMAYIFSASMHNGQQIDFDELLRQIENINLPEPATIFIMGLGALYMIKWRLIIH